MKSAKKALANVAEITVIESEKTVLQEMIGIDISKEIISNDIIKGVPESTYYSGAMRLKILLLCFLMELKSI